MLQVKNFKRLLLAALLVGAAGSVSAIEYGSGLFSVSATKRVRLATANYTEGEKQFFTFAEIADIEAKGHEVLTIEEWQYLFGNFTVDGGRDHAYELFALASVNGVNGLIILPDYDKWVMPAGLEPFNYYDTGEGYDKNTYNGEDWEKMAAAGAVFLPAAGYSEDPAGITPTDEGVHGKYWTCSVDELTPTKAHNFQFDNGYFYDTETWSQTNRYSVRTLVDEAILLDENDSQSTFEAKFTAAKERDYAHIIRTLKKDGTYYTLTLPFDVPDIASSPLAGAEVFTFNSATVMSDNDLDLNITNLVGSSLSHGTPYIVSWANTGETLQLMSFSGVTWDDDTEASSVGIGDVRFQGFYPVTHIDDTMNDDTHLLLFLGGNNTLFWPVQNDATSMRGFRAYFQIIPSGGGAHAPIRRGMSATLRVRNTATGVEEVLRNNVPCSKVFLNGQIVIINNGNIYTLNGQKL